MPIKCLNKDSVYNLFITQWFSVEFTNPCQFPEFPQRPLKPIALVKQEYDVMQHFARDTFENMPTYDTCIGGFVLVLYLTDFKIVYSTTSISKVLGYTQVTIWSDYFIMFLKYSFNFQ